MTKTSPEIVARLKKALESERLLAILLAIVVVAIVARTVWFERETPIERQNSELFERADTALNYTKLAYRPELITAPSAVPPPSPYAPMPARIEKHSPIIEWKENKATKGTTRGEKGKADEPDAFQDSYDKLAIEKWQELVDSKSVTAGEWRRYGVVLALLHKPGALTALDRVATAPTNVQTDEATTKKTAKLKGKRLKRRQSSEASSPFGHGKIPVPYALERSTWQQLYGPSPIVPAEVPSLRQTLQQLRLGWFEHIAVAQLYKKAGMFREASQEARRAQSSASWVSTLDSLQVWSIVIGLFMAIFLGIRALVRFLKRDAKRRPTSPQVVPMNPYYAPQGTTPQTLPARPTYASAPPSATFAQTLPARPTYASPSSETLPQTLPARPTHASVPPLEFDLPPLPVALPEIQPVPPVTQVRPAPYQPVVQQEPTATAPDATLFPMSALLLAFICYLLTHTLLGMGLGLLLRPFADTFDTMDSATLLRLESLLQYLLYIPTFIVPLLILRARAPFDPVTGAKMSMGTLLRRVGYHTDNILKEIFRAGYSYLLLLPGLALTALISAWLFSRFHTPVNPSEFEMLAAHVPLDRLLVLITASFCAPVVEETMFRGILYSGLRARYGVAVGATCSAAVFAIVHPTLPGGFLPIWAIGVALALVYEKRGSLVPGILLHALHNGLIMLMGFAVFSQ